MIKWFKERKELRKFKKENIKYINYLLFSICEVVIEFQNSKKQAENSKITNEEALELMNKLKGIDQKDVVSTLVNAIKSKEKSE